MSAANQQEIDELRMLVLQAYEFMTGEWEPDVIDRAKFVRRLKDAVDDFDPYARINLERPGTREQAAKTISAPYKGDKGDKT